MAITLGQILKTKAEYIVDALKKNLEKHDSIASRKLFQSIRFDIKIFGSSYIFQIIMEDYWDYVDKGIKGSESSSLAPNSPYQYKDKIAKVSEIERWITQKGIKVEISKNKSDIFKKLKNKTVKKSFRQKSILSQRKSMAFGIATNIKKHGVKPTNFYSDVINAKFWTDFKNDIAKTLKKEYTIQIIESIKKENK